MKKALIALVALLPMLVQAPAADTANATKKPAAAADKSAKGAVGAAIKKLTDDQIWSDTKPSAKADYYIYLSSASWCGPCNAEMPHVVEQYKKMGSKVELILVSADSTKEAARGFMDKYGAKFPCVSKAGGATLPGYTAPNGIPNAIFVTKTGKVLKNGHGGEVMNWQSICKAGAGADKADKAKTASAKKKPAGKPGKARKA